MADPFESVVQSVTDKILTAVMPRIQQLTANAAEAASPVISRVVRQDVIPAAAPWLIVGLLGVAVVSAAIGSAMARGPARIAVRRRAA